MHLLTQIVAQIWFTSCVLASCVGRCSRTSMWTPAGGGRFKAEQHKNETAEALSATSSGRSRERLSLQDGNDSSRRLERIETARRGSPSSCKETQGRKNSCGTQVDAKYQHNLKEGAFSRSSKFRHSWAGETQANMNVWVSKRGYQGVGILVARTSTCPSSAALKSAVTPPFSLVSSGRAPCSISWSTIAAHPYIAAVVRGLWPLFSGLLTAFTRPCCPHMLLMRASRSAQSSESPMRAILQREL
jgi:hypothetical protein